MLITVQVITERQKIALDFSQSYALNQTANFGPILPRIAQLIDRDSSYLDDAIGRDVLIPEGFYRLPIEKGILVVDSEPESIYTTCGCAVSELSAFLQEYLVAKQQDHIQVVVVIGRFGRKSRAPWWVDAPSPFSDRSTGELPIVDLCLYIIGKKGNLFTMES